MTDETSDNLEPDRRDALKKAAALSAIAGATWVAPAVNGMSLVPSYASAASGVLPQITVSGSAGKTLGCYSGAGGNDTFNNNLGADGWFNFYFQGCTAFSTESIALNSVGVHTADCFQAPTGYKCRLEVSSSGGSYTSAYNTTVWGSGADTGGKIILGTNAPSLSGSPCNWTIRCIDLTLPG